MKPTPRQLRALDGLHAALALGGKPINAFSPFWGPLRRCKWVSDDGRVTAEGEMALDRYRVVLLSCRHCETTIVDYVAERGRTKTLHRICRTCGSGRQSFVVDGSDGVC